MTRLLRSGLSGLLCWSLFLVPLLVATLSSAEKQEAGKKKWIQLFNGKDLSGWKVKIGGHALGDNLGKPFRVGGGVLKVGYDAYKGLEEVRHLFYEKPFSHYIIRWSTVSPASRSRVDPVGRSATAGSWCTASRPSRWARTRTSRSQSRSSCWGTGQGKTQHRQSLHARDPRLLQGQVSQAALHQFGSKTYRGTSGSP
ncbi:MAG: hypothetical protein Ct9H300mP1_18800 [Planctomycetaceae bacterium]|nr:MAG: hypothetical protein Ct9H300mP1_18800 [Planctomycetaceae bacterium]